jgi:hypothetical protein
LEIDANRAPTAVDVTRLAVRLSTAAYVIVTVATTIAVVLGAGTETVAVMPGIAFLAALFIVDVVVASRVANGPAPARRPRGSFTILPGLFLGYWLGSLWFPMRATVGELTTGGVIDIPANVARVLIFAGAFAMASWIVVLLLPPNRFPVLARLDASRNDAGIQIAPGQGADFVMFGLAMAAVLLPPMRAMDELTAPLGWPLLQVTVAFLVLLPIIKRHWLDGALVVYRVTLFGYAVLLVRLVIGAAPSLTLTERGVLGLGAIGVLTAAGIGHFRTARLRDARTRAASARRST